MDLVPSFFFCMCFSAYDNDRYLELTATQDQAYAFLHGRRTDTEMVDPTLLDD